jgi:hypothetical protein
VRAWKLVAIVGLLIGLSGSASNARDAGPVLVHASTQPLLAVVRGSPSNAAALVRVNPNTLAPGGRRVPLGRYNIGAWAFSPDRRRLAIGVDRALGVRIVDLPTMRSTGDVRTQNGHVLALAWLAPRRIVGLDLAGLFVVDPVAKRMVMSRRVEGTFVGWARTKSSLVLLLGPPPDGIAVAPVRAGAAVLGPARIVAVGADGGVRTQRLDAIRAGATYEEGAPAQNWVPALAVDAAAERAFVVGSGQQLADVDLRTLGVLYHELREPASLLGRALGWLQPAAAAKGPIGGPTRRAAWLGNGLLAIGGDDVHVAVHPRGIDVSSKPFGLKIVDTRTWSVRTLDPGATGFVHASGVLLAYGGSYDEQYRPRGGIGLTAYTLDGTRLYHLFGESPLFWAEVAGANAYVAAEGKIVAVDIARGRVVRSLAGPLPQFVR